nr:non-canonical non-ribosomal peptide synthetase fub8 [Quercus suber]
MTISSYAQQIVTLPRAVAQLAKTNGNGTWASIPRSAELTQGWRNVTYQELCHAMDGMARWLDQNIGSIPQQAVISYMGTTGCKILLFSEGVEPHIKLLASVLPDVRTLQIPLFDDLCELGARFAPYEDKYDEAEDSHVLILHTSGSTGLPKPIYVSHGGIAASVPNFTNKQTTSGRMLVSEVYINSRQLCLHLSPFFHEMGHQMTVKSILIGQPFVMLPAGKPINAVLVKAVLDQTRPPTGTFPPAILEQIVDLPGGLDTLSKMSTIVYGGGPLSQTVGNQIITVTRLITAMGSTEAGFIASLVPTDPNDWMYFEWDPIAGVEMQPEVDGLYELVIKPTDKRHQKVFHTFPQIDEWRTKDLYTQHPTKSDLWCYNGRKDDVLVLSNGEKVQPVDFESRLGDHKLISAALVVGQGRFQTGLLLEPYWDSVIPGEDLDNLLEMVWPAIEEANKTLPEHARVWKSQIVFCKRDKPFVRAAKMTVMRRQTTILYQAEIEALYAYGGNDAEVERLPTDADLSTTKEFIRKIFKIKGMNIPEEFPDDEDIFSRGIDSLQVLALTSILNRSLGPRKSIRASAVYTHPAISTLAAFLLEPDQQSATDAESSRESRMTDMIDRHTTNLSMRKIDEPATGPETQAVILTGSTGTLGNYILQILITSPRIGKIFCLNRSEVAEQRQRKSFADRHANADFSKVTFLHTDFSKDRFGLAEKVYDEMLQVVDTIIHNAWAVDFNKALSSYEQVHITGTRRCVDFSMASKYRAHIVFISSVASIANWSHTHPKDSEVPERLIQDHSLPGPGGYGESKHVASFILAAAAKFAGVPSTIVRSGQIAGTSVSESGNEWNRHEWFPSIVLSSKVMGALPAQLGNIHAIDWVPIDLQAQAVVDIVEVRPTGDVNLRVINLVNPQRCTWEDLLPTVQKELSRENKREVTVVSYAEWVKMLKAVPATKENAEAIPGLKLVDFYEGMSASNFHILETREAAKLSQTVTNMKPINPKLISQWISEWSITRK